MSVRAPVAWWFTAGAVALLVAMHLAYLGGDGLLYIAHGRYMLTHGEVPALDPFSEMSIREPLILHMVLPMLGFAWLESHVGLTGLVLLSAVVGVMVLVMFLLPARRSLVATLAGAGLLALVVQADKEMFGVRGQVFAYLLFAAWLAVCVRTLNGRRPLLPVVVLLPALWANTHPSFLVAVLLPLLFAAALLVEPARDRRPARALIALSLVAVLASFLSPYGPRLIVDVVKLLFDDTTQKIEHMRTPPVSIAWVALLAMLCAVPAVRALRGSARHRRLHVLVALAWVAMTLISRRYAAYAAAWSIWLLADAFRDVKLSEQARRILVVGTGIVFLAALPMVPGMRDLDHALPVEATTVLETVPTPPRLFNEFGWGGYLMYRFGEQRPVFIDGRNNLYRNGVFEDYLAMTFAAPTLDALLDLYGINTVLWTSGWDLDRALAQRQAWRLLYRDDKAVIYVRR